MCSGTRLRHVQSNFKVLFFAFTSPVNTTYVGFHAVRTSSDDVDSGGVVVYDSVYMDVGAAYNAGNGIFTCPVIGYYYFAVTCYTEAGVCSH